VFWQEFNIDMVINIL